MAEHCSPEELVRLLRSAGLRELHAALGPLAAGQAGRGGTAATKESLRANLDSICKDVGNLAAAESSIHWTESLLAFVLPLLSDALPKDQHGTSVIPHPHPMRKAVLPDSAQAMTISGQVIYESNRACDNCDAHITDKEYWHCHDGCDVDFCKKCHEQLDALFSNRDMKHVLWVVQFVWFISEQILMASPSEREAILRSLAFQWPIEMFQQLVKAVVDVADASVVHVEDMRILK